MRKIHITAALGVAVLGLGLLGLAAPTTRADEGDDWREGYPEHWWKPIDDPEKPEWEILPQEAGEGEVILSKRNELGILSNFTKAPFDYRGKHYESVEGLWQCLKYPEGPDDPRAKHEGITWKHTREEVMNMVAFEANKAGREAEKNMKAMGIDWVSFEGEQIAYRDMAAGSKKHYEIILGAMWAKLQQNPEVKKVLLATGDLVLKPDHHQKPDRPDAWRYFDMWMKIRADLKAGKTGPVPEAERKD